ncbi:hypothetical protein SSTU70S_05584 [Stutzerimonas stutzeri]
MARDNFSAATKSALARNVHFRCVYPGCPLVTHASTPSGDNVNLGHAAHISGASQGGPRFDDELTPAQRRAYENGAWLCANHATLVDDDPLTFTLEIIRGWQRKMEESARASLYGTRMNANFDFSEICRKLELFLKACRKATFRGYLEPAYIQVPRESLIALQELISQCPEGHWRPVHPWHSLHPITHMIQVRAVNAARCILQEVTDCNKWHSDGCTYMVIGGANNWGLTSADTARANQTATVVGNALSEFNDCIAHLNEYAAGNRHPGNII